MHVILILFALLAARAIAYADGLDDWKRVTSLNDGIVELRLLNNELVALGTNGIHRSTDGISWATLPPVPRGAGSKSITFGNGIYCSVGAQFAATSTDLTNWTVRILGGVNYLVSSTFGNDRFLVLDAATANLWTSVNAVDWSLSRAAPNANSLSYSPGGFLATGPETAFSPDGTTWMSAGVSLRDAAYRTNGWVSLGTTSGQIRFSADGTGWIISASLSAENLVRISYGAGRLVAVGEPGTVWTSLDGSNWTGRFLSEDVTLRFIVYDGSAFVGMTSDGAVYRSGRITPEDTTAKLELALYPGVLISGTVGARYNIEASGVLGGHAVTL